MSQEENLPFNEKYTLPPYKETYRRSLEDSERFWKEQALELEWTKPFSKVLDESNAPFYRWFPDGLINITQKRFG